MKKHISTTLLVFCSVLYVSGQIQLEHTFNYSATVTKINDNDYKYFLMDAGLNECRIYNTDFTLFKTIGLDVPSGSYLYDVRFVSQTLFHLDNNIEILYTYYTWIITNETTQEGYYQYHSKVINEQGTVLLNAPGILYSYVKNTGQDEFSLFLYGYDYSVSPNSIWTNIYSLEGEPYSTGIDDLNEINIGDAYPNPLDDYLYLTYVLPENSTVANLVITDMKGEVISQNSVDGFTNHIRINAGTLLPGTYLYYISNGKTRSQAKKIIIK